MNGFSKALFSLFTCVFVGSAFVPTLDSHCASPALISLSDLVSVAVPIRLAVAIALKLHDLVVSVKSVLTCYRASFLVKTE